MSPVIEVVVNSPEAWSERAATQKTSWDAAGWTQAGQSERFAKVLEALQPRAGERVLDYGCGTGALAELLPDGVGYLGYDTAPGMVARAEREHPGRRFQAWEPGYGFELVACIGCFSLPGGWSKEMTWATLRRLWDQTGRALAVSLYAGTDEQMLVYTETEVAKFAGGMTWRSRVERWRHNDLLMVLER